MPSWSSATEDTESTISVSSVPSCSILPFSAREAKIPPAAQPRLAEAIRHLVDLYTAWEKPEEAEKWRNVREAAKENGSKM